MRRKQSAYDEIKKYVKETAGLSVSSLYIAQVKQKWGGVSVLLAGECNYNCHRNCVQT